MKMMLATDVLDVLCPMHLTLNATGHITHAGPTIQKLRADVPMIGRRFLEVFAVKRPRSINGMDDLRRATDLKLHLEMRDAPRTQLKGILVPTTAEDDSTILAFSALGIPFMDGPKPTFSRTLIHSKSAPC